MSRVSTRVLAVCTAGLVLTGAAACGNKASSKTPRDELTSSIDSIGDSKTMTVTFKLDATAAQLQEVATATGSTMDARVAGLLAGADVKAQIVGDKNLKDYKPGDTGSVAFDLSADVDGGAVVDIRTVDKVLYLKADVEKILTLMQKQKVMSELQARAATLPAFVQAAVAGKWVSFPADQAKALASQMGGSATASPSGEQAQKLIEQLKAILSRDATVKRLSTGGAKGDHLQVSASTKALASDLSNTAKSLVPGAGALSSQLDPSKVKDQTVTVDVYVKNGKLSEISLDTAQFATGADAAKVQGKHLPLVMRFDDSATSIAKPEGATQIDLSQILPLLGAFSGGSSLSGGSSTAPLTPLPTTTP